MNLAFLYRDYPVNLTCLLNFNLKESTVLEVILDDNIRDCIKHELNVVGIRGTSEMSVDLFSILSFI